MSVLIVFDRLDIMKLNQQNTIGINYEAFVVFAGAVVLESMLISVTVKSS